MGTRRDYYRDPDAPTANSLIPGGSAVVTDDQGRILLQQRSDNGNWALPGGTMDIGETLPSAVVREVREETGLDVEITGIVGIFTDPEHVIAYADGEVRQQFNVTFTARVVGGELAVSPESFAVRLMDPAEISELPMHDTIRLRLHHHLKHPGQPYIG
jgi:ADP-ribose pyrophosphatase YjhB (NUDIX family)